MPTWEDIAATTDRDARSRRLTCTNVLIGLNAAGFLLSGVLPKVLGVDATPLAFDARLAIGKLWLWQFATYSFVQLVDIFYFFFFVFGVYALYLLGNELEAEIGKVRCLVYYFSFAAYGAAVHGFYQYVANSSAIALGLFGPVYGIAVVYALRHPHRPVLFFFIIPMRMITCVTLLGILCAFYCIIDFQAGLSPFSILGAAAAAFGAVKLEPRLDRLLERRSARRDRARLAEESEIRREVDRILEKISREGMGSLTRAEKKTLKRASDLAARQRGYGDG